MPILQNIFCCHVSSLALKKGWTLDPPASSQLIVTFWSRIDILSISCEIALRWTPWGLTDGKTTLVLVMAWCCRYPALPEPKFTKFYDPHIASLGHNVLTLEMPWDFATLWCHQMETFSVLLALCVGNSPVTGEFPTQRPVTRGFDAFFDLRLNKRLSKQSWGWWFEMPSRPLWHHCNEISSAILNNVNLHKGDTESFLVSKLGRKQV